MSRRNALYVGGLGSEVTEEILLSAFLPFGEIKSVQIPRDHATNKSKGFGFVEFDLVSDCADALENMEGSELFGKTLRCTIAKAVPGNGQENKGKAIWSSDEWISQEVNSNDNEK